MKLLAIKAKAKQGIAPHICSRGMKHTILIAIERKTTGFTIKLSAISKPVTSISGKVTGLS